MNARTPISLLAASLAAISTPALAHGSTSMYVAITLIFQALSSVFCVVVVQLLPSFRHRYLFAMGGFVLGAALYWVIFGVDPQWSFMYRMPGWFIYVLLFGFPVVGVVAMVALGYRWMVTPNTTPHADARDVPAPAEASGARAGGRER